VLDGSTTSWEALGAPPRRPVSAGTAVSRSDRGGCGQHALTNLGAQQGAAQMAVRKAAASGAPKEFEPLFRRALELLR